MEPAATIPSWRPAAAGLSLLARGVLDYQRYFPDHPLCLDRLVRPGVVGLSRLVEAMSLNPARILRVPKGTLAPGADADLTVLDLGRKVTVDPSRFASKSANTPFAGWTLTGAPVMTIARGRVIHDAR